MLENAVPLMGLPRIPSGFHSQMVLEHMYDHQRYFPFIDFIETWHVSNQVTQVLFGINVQKNHSLTTTSRSCEGQTPV